MKKTVGFSAIFIFLFSMGHFCLAQERPAEKARPAPLNPEFIKYQDLVKSGRAERYSADWYPLGRVPAPVDLSHVRPVVNPGLGAGYPSTYDLRSLGKVTDVRDQGSCGACWAFSAMACLESALKPDDTWDFSEQHLNSTHGFDYGECEGGNSWMSAAYFTRWDGPINESDLAYPYAAPFAASTAAIDYTTQKHVQQIVFLPERANPLDNNLIKYYLTHVGAGEVSFRYQARSYNPGKYSYYYNGSKNDEVNHMVAIVGWDDAYAASNFLSTPPGNGAFLAKNSWGSGWGDDGYFYISYYDTSLTCFVSYAAPELNNNFQRIYQYDPLGWVNNWGWDDTVGWGANIFVAQDDLPLRAVGLYATDADVDYTITIYTGVTAQDPRSGTLRATLKGTRPYPGFYTEILGAAVPLTRGEHFSVVIKFTTPTKGYPIAIEYSESDYSSAATAHNGESFSSHNGSAWEDINLDPEVDHCNVCIKAYASAGSIQAPLNLSGRKLLNRSFSQAEYIDVLSWEANPENNELDIAGYRIYEKSSVNRTLLEEVTAGQTEYTRRQAGTGARTYVVAAFTGDGREGSPAAITVE
jgi:C1A family cysteine protease